MICDHYEDRKEVKLELQESHSDCLARQKDLRVSFIVIDEQSQI
jgi:hypothetical protein